MWVAPAVIGQVASRLTITNVVRLLATDTDKASTVIGDLAIKLPKGIDKFCLLVYIIEYAESCKKKGG